MLDAAQRELIDRTVLCWLATANEDNQPSVSPKQIFTAFDHQIVIANIASPNSAGNIKRNPRVCATFLDVFIQKGIQVYANAEVINKADDRFEPLAAPLRALAGEDFPFASLFSLTPTRIKPVIAPRYRLFPGTAESDQIEDAMRTYGVRPAH